MANVRDVATYILLKRAPMSAMKLQKLCYYSYGYHLAWEERALFPEPIEAWANGPVIPALYRLHRGRYTLSKQDATDWGGDADALDGGERESIDIVLDHLGDRSAHELSQMTHQEPPWREARKRSGAEPLDRSTERLAVDEVAEYFDTLVSNAT